MQVIAEEGRAPIKCWTDGVELEDQARQQLLNVATLPFIHHHMAVMPDVHWGMGATVGSVIPTVGAIVPAAVGVDIGCGMVAYRTDFDANELPSLALLRQVIEEHIPVGRTNNGGPDDRGARREIDANTAGLWEHLEPGYRKIVEKHPKLARANTVRHLGTLGTGNHFIEVCLDEGDRVWVMLHSGSRGVGNAIGSYFIDLARQDMRRWFINLPDENLAYLPEGTEHFADYIEAVEWAQEFALLNRWRMLGEVLGFVIAACRGYPPPPDDFMNHVRARAVNCHHNYVAREAHFGKNVWLTRKGAVRAREGDLGIIPGSMGARSYIVRGKGNPESFHSCSHGAGRRMSRGEAKRRFTVEDHVLATAGVECRKDAAVIDETPGAYKSIDAVMAAQADLVEVVHTLRQVVCVKG